MLSISLEEQGFLLFPAHSNVISSYSHLLYSQLGLEALASLPLCFPDIIYLVVSKSRLKMEWSLLSGRLVSRKTWHVQLTGIETET